MIPKSKLRKCDIPKLNEIAQRQTIPQNLTNCLQQMRQKNQKNINNKLELQRQISDIRENMRQIINDMNDSTKDRIQKKSKQVMDNSSRPQKEDIKRLTDLYTLMEKQSNLASRNTNHAESITNMIKKQITSLQEEQKSIFKDYSHLDEQFHQLSEQCDKQIKVKQQIMKQRDQKRRFYESIESNIEQCRVEYELVESKIRDAQRQLIQLTGYYQNRKQEQKDIIGELLKQASSIQDKIMRAQEILNKNETKRQNLQIIQIQTQRRASLTDIV